jgi:hypothetical protein
MSARDEMALELFIGDNFNQSREKSLADWEYFHAEAKFQGRIEHYFSMADAILAAGYRKPRTITTAEELDALLDGAVVMGFDDDMDQLVSRKLSGIWEQSGTNDGWQSAGIIQWHGSVTVLYEPEPQP